MHSVKYVVCMYVYNASSGKASGVEIRCSFYSEKCLFAQNISWICSVQVAVDEIQDPN